METIAELEQLGYDTLLPKHDDHDEHDVDKDHETKTERSFKSGHDENICHSKQVRPHGTVSYGDQYVWTDLKTQSTIFCRKQMRPHGAVIYGNNPWHGECQPFEAPSGSTSWMPHDECQPFEAPSGEQERCSPRVSVPGCKSFQPAVEKERCSRRVSVPGCKSIQPAVAKERRSPRASFSECIVISGRKTQVRPHGTVSYWKKYVWAALRMQSLKIRKCFTSTHTKSALRVRDSTKNTLCYDDSTALKPMMQSTERCSPILGHGKCYLKKQVRPHGTVLY